MEQENLYNIVLTKEQAETLRIVCGHISGSPARSRRKHMDSIKNKLVNLGFVNYNMQEEYFEDGCDDLEFKDDVPPPVKMTLEQIEEALGHSVEIV